MFITTIWEKIKELVNKMVGPKSIEQVYHLSPIISNDMLNAINLWGDMYSDKSPWLKQGVNGDPVTIVSMGLASLISSEMARTAVLEMKVEINAPVAEVEEKVDTPPEMKELDKITGVSSDTVKKDVQVGTSDRADYLNRQFDKVRNSIRRQLEYGIAKGGLVIKPYVVFPTTNGKPEVAENNANKGVAKPTADTKGGVQSSNIGNTNAEKKNITEDEDINKPKIEFDYVQADEFYPMAFDGSDRLTEAAFAQRKQDKNITYTRIEYHKLVGDTVTIENRVFRSENNGNVNYFDTDLGQEVSLKSVPEWAGLERRTTIRNVDRLLFAYFRMPEANTIDPHSPLGVSGFSRAVRLIEQADKQFSRMLWEFEGGELAIDVDRLAFKEIEDSQGNEHTVRPVMQERLFRKIDLNQEETYNVFSPPLRDASLINGLNTILMRIEDVTGLSRGTISDASAEARTATELKILRQRSYSSNAELQKSLESALKDVIYIMNVYCDIYDITPDGEYSVGFEWDDSILVDVEAELGKRITLMQNGLSSKLENRMWYFGETEAQAKEALMKIDKESLQAIQQNMQIQNEYGQETQNNKNTNSIQSTEQSKENKQEQKKKNTEMKNENEQ